VPVIIADLSPVKAKAYRIADNRINQDSEWDFSKLKLEFKDISKLDFNLDSLGFEKNELDDLIIDEVKGFTDDDAVPDKPKKPKSKLGEIYQLGHHRVMCGDATKEEDVKKLMNSQKADMVFTDPPYNINYQGGTKIREKMKNDQMNNYYEFLLSVFNNYRLLMKSGASIYVCHADSERVNVTKSFQDADFYFSSVIIWSKDNSTFGRQDYFWKHEPILYGWSKDSSHSWYGANNEETVWNIKRPSKSLKHPIMKPIELIDRALKNSSRINNIILDLFGGSGSTLIACAKTNRNCYMMELDPIYVDVIIKRWEDYTGKSSKKI